MLVLLINSRKWLESIHISLVSSRLKDSFEMIYACLESIQVYSANTCLVIALK